MSRTTNWSVHQMLAGLAFPAPRWRVLAQAELYGVDGATHERLHRLPERWYRSCDEVVAALDAEPPPDS